MWKFAIENDIERKLKSLNKNIALQGEIIGEGIQKNKYKQRGQTIYFFNVFDIDSYAYLSLNEVKILMKELELNMVPVLDENYLLESSVESVIIKSQLRSVLNKETIAEGIVIRPVEEKMDRSIINGRISFKAINPNFLIKYDE